MRDGWERNRLRVATRGAERRDLRGEIGPKREGTRKIRYNLPD